MTVRYGTKSESRRPVHVPGSTIQVSCEQHYKKGDPKQNENQRRNGNERAEHTSLPPAQSHPSTCKPQIWRASHRLNETDADENKWKARPNHREVELVITGTQPVHQVENCAENDSATCKHLEAALTNFTARGNVLRCVHSRTIVDAVERSALAAGASRHWHAGWT